jgi:hypothetical protein
VSLLKTIAIICVIGVVLFDIGAVIVNHVQLDEATQNVLRETSATLDTTAGRRPDVITATAQEAAARRSDRAVVEEAVLDESGFTVTMSQEARVLLLDRLGPLSDYATARVTKSAEPAG